MSMWAPDWWSSASRPSAAASTSKPAKRSEADRSSRIEGSSSTTRIVASGCLSVMPTIEPKVSGSSLIESDTRIAAP